MRIKIQLFVSLLFLSFCMQAQIMPGFHTDNYSGVYSLGFNPAEIVDSRYKVHVNILSLGGTFSNNYIGLKREAIIGDYNAIFSDSMFQDKYLVERLDGKTKAAYASLDLGLPSFMLTFGKKKERAIGFQYRLRTNINVNGVDERTARQTYNELDIPELLSVGIQNKNFSLQASVWNEIGLTYGQEVLNKGPHYLKVAGTLKLIQGLGSAYMYSDNMDIVFPTDSTLTVNNSDVKFGYSEIFSSIAEGPAAVYRNTRFGFGADLGVVYEFRPKHASYKYELDNNPDYMDPRKNKYKLKIGLGVTDLGYASYARARGYDGDFYANVNDINLEREFQQSFEDFENTGLTAFADTLNVLITLNRSSEDFYNVTLPTRINLYADYNIWKGFYVNFTASIAPGYDQLFSKTSGLSEFSLTPRFEHKWFGVYLPFSINTHGNMHFGTGFRFGPLVIGTYDITPFLGKSLVESGNFYLAMSVPIYRPLKDKDKDHVSDKFDKCLDAVGTWASSGCPDRDKDGIVDINDICPDVPGLPKFKGCPDTDGDNIIDKDDRCPEVAGIVEFEGCPDTDADGIEDSADKCPELAGLPVFDGCPDTDEDGVEDTQDKCPTTPGSKEFAGCPDSDQDGTSDNEDACPQTAGPLDNKGCPYTDTDNDGVLDKDDDCVTTPGLVENKGCPAVVPQPLAETNFEVFEFELEKAILKPASFPTLDKIVGLMKASATMKIKVVGHTDNTGAAAFNMLLSKQRAEAVQKYITSKGIDKSRLVIEAYGQEKPVADNKTAAGRRKNRRVEIKIIAQ